MQERITLYPDLYTQGVFFFGAPSEYDTKQVKKRYSPDIDDHFLSIKTIIRECNNDVGDLTSKVKSYLNDNELKMGVYMPLLRIMMCGSLTGPDLFDIISLLGVDESCKRIDVALDAFKNLQ
jgi:glutamyl-tRNA synthetase